MAPDRPRKPKKRASSEIDYEKVFKLAAEWWSQDSIAIMLGWNVDAFARRKRLDKMLRNALEYGASIGRAQIKKKQFDKAVIEKDTKMLIHLGEVYCDQVKKSKLDISGEVKLTSLADIAERVAQGEGNESNKAEEDGENEEDEIDPAFAYDLPGKPGRKPIHIDNENSGENSGKS